MKGVGVFDRPPFGRLMETKKFPLVSKELLEELEKRFPDRLPDYMESNDSIRYRSGQVSVIRLLRHQFELQNLNVLET
jgi:hypothetical protein